jgi:opacity protein-like surface antigen
MGVFEARKGKLVFLTDLEYVSIEDEGATPGPLFSNVTAKFKTFIFDPEVGYRIYDDPAKGAYVDVLGGIRIWHVSTELDFGAGILPATQVQGSRNWVDAVVGLRGKAALSEKVFVTGKFDLGGGGSKFTYQLFGGGGYNINQKVALIFGYRVLDVNYNKNNFIYDMNQRGPIMGVGFKF